MLYERRQKEEEWLYWKEERKLLQQSARFLRELEEACEVLTRAYLIAAGYHKHRGEWRKRRESA